MKRAIILLLAVLYLGITAGVMVNVHYCMGEIASVNYGLEKQHACDKCGMEQKDGCCHTEHKIIKSDADQIFSTSEKLFHDPLANIPLVYFNEISYTYPSTRQKERFHYNPPPGDYKLNGLYMYNSVFRI